MNWILVAAFLTGAPEMPVARVSPAQAVEHVLDNLQTGSLMVSKGDCLAVKIYSASEYTHVAAVVIREGEAFVYDATGGAGVRRQPLHDYCNAQAGHIVHLFHPRNSLSEARAARFEEHLESQLGRPYAIHHHLTGERAAGLHCSEYVTDALIAAETLRARQPSRVSPATLVEGILKADLYRQAESLQILPESPAPPAALGWCARLWWDTKQCTGACCGKLRGWFFCK